MTTVVNSFQRSGKIWLCHHGIRPIVSAAPWQRGRIERHGGIIEDMLDRIDQDQRIDSQEKFDEALNQCFGFSPEQAVLGRASHLPASIVSDRI